MTNLEWEILDNVYLMVGYQVVRESVNASDDDFNASLVELMKKGWLRQLIYSEKRKDYEDVEPFDASILSSSQLVISKNGLVAHTSS
jgi:hypothetical protein